MAEVKITSENFDEEVVLSQQPVFIDFWAEWCGPCRMVAPIFAELSESYGDRVKFAKLNIDEERELAVENGVASIPTLILFREGAEADRIVGARPKDDFIDFLERNLSNENK